MSYCREMLREFLYVDQARIQSLLAQLDRGRVESVVESSSVERSRDALALAKLGGAIRSGTAHSIATTKSLDDLSFVTFEEAAESSGLIRDLELGSPGDWESSQVQSGLIEGEIIRVTTDVQVLDASYVGARFESHHQFTEALVKMNSGTADAAIDQLEKEIRQQADSELEGLPRDQRRAKQKQVDRQIKQALAAAKRAADEATDDLGGATAKLVPDVLNAFHRSDAISVRFPAFTDATSAYGFVGSLLGRDSYIQRERQSLFSRYGSTLRGFTSVLMVARVPTSDEHRAAREMSFADIDIATDGVVDRSAVERASLDLLAHVDALGVSEGPRWPTVSVIPLGIYRLIPRSVELGGDTSDAN